MKQLYDIIIKNVNESRYKIFVTTTGGGQSFLSKFMEYPGASNTIIGGYTPYSKEMFEDFCGKTIDKYCSEESALLLATQSYFKCITKTDYPKEDILGIGVTCSLATTNERKGRTHKAFIAIHNHNFSIKHTINFIEGLSRSDEETIVVQSIFVLLHSILRHDVFNDYLAFSTKLSIHNIIEQSYDTLDNINKIELTDTLALYPGSWNPMHQGHKDIIQLAESILNTKVYCELSMYNADKGILDYFELDNRIRANPSNKIVISREPTFISKAQALYHPNQQLVFIVGSDTWNRIADPVYAGPIDQLYNEFVRYNVKFLVFARDGYPILHNTLSKLLIQSDLAANFNNPISSTKLRQ